MPEWSMPEPDDEWVLVARKKSSRNLAKYVKEQSLVDKCEDKYQTRESNDKTFTRTLDDVRRCIAELTKAEYLKNIIRELRKCLTVLKLESVSEIVCYGLGHISENKSSRYQLALLICLLDEFQQDDFHQPLPTYAYDPVFSPVDIKLLRHFGIHAIEKNEGGQRVVHDDKITLTFMPHCHFYLVNSFLYANWESKKLSNCILLVNSFSEVVHDTHYPADVKVLLKAADYLLRIAPYVTEYKLDNTFEYEYAFSALSIHIFTESRLQDLSKTFWKYREKPEYSKVFCDFIPE